jgi:GMP synthase (glutamine-hydrolysing)
VETQSIVVLDFGAQYSQLIARRIREQKVFSVVLPFNASLEEIRSYSPVGIILSGGPSSVYDKGAPHADKKVFDLGLPVLGICYGLQFMVYALGGKVRPAAKREYGHAKVEIQESDSELFQGLPKLLAVWMSHGDSAEELPPGFRLTAKTPNAVAAIENAERKMWAVQFHPEVHHTPLGKDILRNFALNICGANPSWTPQHFIDATVAQVKQQVGKGRAICALSGGVDSSVAAVLVDRALRDDTGQSVAESVAAPSLPRSLRQGWERPAPIKSSPVSSSTTAFCARTSSRKCRRICATISDCIWLRSMPPTAS